MKQVTVLSPATVANIVCGFDVLGLALYAPSDKLVMRLLNKREIRIVNKDSFNLPIEPEKNVFGGALFAMMKEIKEEIHLFNNSIKDNLIFNNRWICILYY